MATKKYGMGWQRDLPDIRDYTPETKKIEKLFHKSKALNPPKAGIKKSVDLRPGVHPSRTRAALVPAPPTRAWVSSNIMKGALLGSTWMLPDFFFTRSPAGCCTGRETQGHGFGRP